MTVAAIPPLGFLEGSPVAASPTATAPSTGGASFGQFLTDGIARVQQDVATADRTVKAFVLDDSIPMHQVSFALAQAKLSMELALQVRSRLVEGYQQLMNMQM